MQAKASADGTNAGQGRSSIKSRGYLGAGALRQTVLDRLLDLTTRLRQHRITLQKQRFLLRWPFSISISSPRTGFCSRTPCRGPAPAADRTPLGGAPSDAGVPGSSPAERPDRSMPSLNPWVLEAEGSNLPGYPANNMNKILDFGKRALFLIRVISGFEERRIRAHRLELQRRMEQAQAKKESMRRIPEQAILDEVRQMVGEMQTVLRKFEETEAAIEEYLKPFDKNAEIIMNMQLEKEEKSAKEMIKTLREQAMLQALEQDRMRVTSGTDKQITATGSADANQESAASPASEEPTTLSVEHQERTK